MFMRVRGRERELEGELRSLCLVDSISRVAIPLYSLVVLLLKPYFFLLLLSIFLYYLSSFIVSFWIFNLIVMPIDNSPNPRPHARPDPRPNPRPAPSRPSTNKLTSLSVNIYLINIFCSTKCCIGASPSSLSSLSIVFRYQ